MEILPQLDSSGTWKPRYQVNRRLLIILLCLGLLLTELHYIKRTLSLVRMSVPRVGRVVLFGDSITERSFSSEGGWGAALANFYARRLDVVNRGFSGYNTRWALPVLQHLVQSEWGDVQLTIIFFGANDAARPDRSSAVQCVPVEEYAANLEQMHKLLVQQGSRVLLITPPPIYEPARALQQQLRTGSVDLPDPDRTNDYTGKYAAACRDLGKHLKAPVVDLWTRLQETAGWEELYLMDGLHLSPAGNQQVYKLLLETLLEAYPALSPERLRPLFPLYDNLRDLKDSQKALAAVQVATRGVLPA